MTDMRGESVLQNGHTIFMKTCVSYQKPWSVNAGAQTDVLPVYTPQSVEMIINHLIKKGVLHCCSTSQILPKYRGEEKKGRIGNIGPIFSLWILLLLLLFLFVSYNVQQFS